MKELYIQITASTSEDEIDSILLEDMNADIKYIFAGDDSIRDRLIDLSNLYGISFVISNIMVEDGV